MATFISHSPEKTVAFGEEWGRTVKAGTVIGLAGDLGAGKTQFVIGLARGLGITARVQSPTFALVHEYSEGRLPLAHIDLYRLDTPEQIIGAGLHEYLESPKGVVVVEWCDRWPAFRSGQLPPQFCRVQIKHVDELTRSFMYDDSRP
jgi:tRNA threonylcarbamoyladenosine biosynthesis protein TsaE